jgi:aspartyl/glutamyl-tRNA(Asn/Gln) amidotransferase C subunit
MKVDIGYLENLSKLRIKEEEKESFESSLESILEFVDDITKLELPDEDKSRAIDMAELREDEVLDAEKCDVISNAPKKKDGCYVTPLVVE